MLVLLIVSLAMAAASSLLTRVYLERRGLPRDRSDWRSHQLRQGFDRQIDDAIRDTIEAMLDEARATRERPRQ